MQHNASLPSLPTHNPSAPPERVAFNFRNIRSFPARFFHPPNVPHVPTRLSYRVKPHFTVTLDDILSNKHLAPLSATDFENFLTYVEHEQGSVQNLYFLLWLHQYTKQYNEWKGTISAQPTPSSSQAPRSTVSSSLLSKSSSLPSKLPPSSPIQRGNIHGTTAPPASTDVRNVGLHNPVHASADPVGRPRTSTRAPPSTPLAYSWYRARRTFFLPLIADGGPLSTATNPVYQSHLRLKIHPEMLRWFIADAPHGMFYDRFPRDPLDDTEDEISKKGLAHDTGIRGSGLVHPPPESFALIKQEVELRLNESLKRFIDVSFTNTGNHRGIFGTTISLVSILGAVLLLLAVGFWKWSYFYFILTWFLLWVGSWGVLVTINGICFCVFLFGSRQWFHYEIEQCNLPRPSPGSDGRELETIKVPSVYPVSTPDDASEATGFHELETQKEAREQKEEAERRSGLAEARARIAPEGWGPQGRKPLEALGGKLGGECVTDSRPQAFHSETDSSIASQQSIRNVDAGIFISEAYSEGFSAPTSPIQVSLTASSVADLSEQPHYGRAELYHRDESLIEVNSACDAVIGQGSSVDSSATRLRPPDPIPLGPRSAPSEYARTDDTPWPNKLQSVSVAGEQAVAELEGPSPPQQLIPHDHERLKSSHIHHQRRVPINIAPSSDAPKAHKHRERRPHTVAHGASAERDTGSWPRFDFDKLPKEPPPPQLTGNRRAISFTAPMTSIQHCPLVVRMHWLVVVRSILWGTVISIIVEAACIGVILGTQMS